MDIISLYKDFGLDWKTEGHKHCRPGFVNVECPFCSGNPGYHLSYNLDENYFVCWRCGWHPIVDTLSELLKVDKSAAYHISKQYGVISYSQSVRTPKKVKVHLKKFKFPSNTEPLLDSHKKYLENREFDPDKLEKEWNLFSTGVFSKLDKTSYKHRIIIPFTWDNAVVSFDSRDTTNKTQNKYMACPIEREIIEHKKILYGNQALWKSTGICVEGPTDVWRFGGASFATSGIKFTTAQVRTMKKNFKRIAVVYDDESQAVIQANLLVAALKFRGVDAFRVDIQGDPGSMKQDDADHLVRTLL